jgi:Rho-binding antiterminator
MQTPQDPYKPIDCNYYDRLEAWATLRTVCRILYRDKNEQQQEVSAIIKDVYTVLKVEYMRLDNGLVIRLDNLVAVNDIPVPDHC